MLRNESLLLDMLQAARDAAGFVAGLNQAQFNASKLHQNAVIRGIEIIGEVAGKVSPGFRQAHPEIPWSDIIGMRHRVIHNYNDVRLDLVRDVARDRLPGLIATIQPLVPPVGAED